MDQFLIEQPCRHIALRRDGSVRFQRSQPAHPAWMVALWQRDYLTGWLCNRPYGTNGIALALNAIWSMDIPAWPLQIPKTLTIDATTLQLNADLPHLLGGSDLTLRESAHLSDQAGSRLLDFEWCLEEIADQMAKSNMGHLTADDTCWMATEFGYFVPVGRQRDHPKLFDLLLALARANDHSRHSQL